MSLTEKFFRWRWKNHFAANDEPTIIKITGWNSCLWNTREGKRERVAFMGRAWTVYE